MEITGKYENGELLLSPAVLKKLNIEEGQKVIVKSDDKLNGKSTSQKGKRKGGQWRGKVKMADDFDTLPDEIIKAFYGENNQ